MRIHEAGFSAPGCGPAQFVNIASLETYGAEARAIEAAISSYETAISPASVRKDRAYYRSLGIEASAGWVREQAEGALRATLSGFGLMSDEIDSIVRKPSRRYPTLYHVVM